MSPAQGIPAFWQTIHQISPLQTDYPSFLTQLIAQIAQILLQNLLQKLIHDKVFVRSTALPSYLPAKS